MGLTYLSCLISQTNVKWLHIISCMWQDNNSITGRNEIIIGSLSSTDKSNCELCCSPEHHKETNISECTLSPVNAVYLIQLSRLSEYIHIFNISIIWWGYKPLFWVSSVIPFGKCYLPCNPNPSPNRSENWHFQTTKSQQGQKLGVIF